MTLYTCNEITGMKQKKVSQDNVMPCDHEEESIYESDKKISSCETAPGNLLGAENHWKLSLCCKTNPFK